MCNSNQEYPMSRAEPVVPACKGCDKPGGTVVWYGDHWHKSCLAEFRTELNKWYDELDKTEPKPR